MKGQTTLGINVTWGASHHSKGRLISRQASIEPPGQISCVKITCLWKYTIKSIKYVLIELYHKYRVEYAEKHRNDDIPMDYRTGENTPTGIVKLLIEIFRLKGDKEWRQQRNLQQKDMQRQ